MGSWDYRQADEHKCDYPKFALPHDAEVGDRWRCECGNIWKIRKIRVTPGDRPWESDAKVAEWVLHSMNSGGPYDD